MKVNCPQCGAEQIVIESDFFLRCPYCDARIIVDPPGNTPELVSSAVTEEYVRRLFPPGMVSSVEMKYFPYLETGISSGGEIQPCFSQPWQELEDYLPPSGNRKVFDESLVDPDQVIPFDRDMLEENPGRVIFHPFYVVMLKLEGYGEGLLVDAVSGKIVGESPVTEDKSNREQDLYRTFLRTLLTGLIFTVPIYCLTRNIDFSSLSRVWTYAIVIPLIFSVYYFKIKGGRK